MDSGVHSTIGIGTLSDDGEKKTKEVIGKFVPKFVVPRTPVSRSKDRFLNNFRNFRARHVKHVEYIQNMKVIDETRGI